jgi:hypothetical protein
LTGPSGALLGPYSSLPFVCPVHVTAQLY